MKIISSTTIILVTSNIMLPIVEAGYLCPNSFISDELINSVKNFVQSHWGHQDLVHFKNRLGKDRWRIHINTIPPGHPGTSNSYGIFNSNQELVNVVERTGRGYRDCDIH
ncbi:CSEP0043 putative effector protein [Blumeria hordei DH14]|uniref:CSEP0043 putative effector protein n=1 Tax=Blumeria graminis f. sp. hordei (strain DH14) TaxID=546991 RepID=N1J9T4_BLUG1|nr:CSEP0043 putative effector protein [Blumeria hordei DH14]